MDSANRGGWEVAAGGKLMADYTLIHVNRKAAIVCSLKYRKGHDVPLRPRWSFTAV